MSDCKVYTGLSYEEYEALDGLRQSEMNKFAESPRHLKWYLDHKAEDEEETDALRLGTAVDTAVFFPETFARRYVAMKKVDKRFKEGKAYVAAFEFDNAGKVVLSEDEYRDVLGMCRSISEMHCAMALLANSENQLTIVWTDKASGVRCKARLDGYNQKIKTAYDLKTTRSVTKFARSIPDYGYHRQAAWYTRACLEAGLPCDHFCFIAVDKSPPFGVMVFRFNDTDIGCSWRQCEGLLVRYAECMKANDWPCYPDFIKDISLPEWAREKLLED